jgi:type IV secretion system protein VirB5
MKKILTSIMLLMASKVSFSTGIPVVDALSIAKQVANQVQIMEQWKQQFGQMTSQINQLQQTYNSLTGIRNMGQIANNPALRNYLPQDWQQVYDAVSRGGYQGLTGSAQSIFANNQVYDLCAHRPTQTAKTLCEAMSVKSAQDKAYASTAYNAAQSRLGQIDQLMGQINNTQDPKAIAELQARIATEQANIANESTKLQLYDMMAKAEDRLQEQKQRELNAQVWDRDGMIQAKPLTFNR